MSIDENGGRFDSNNKMGENVVRIAVGSDGGGHLDKIDKFGYVKQMWNTSTPTHQVSRQMTPKQQSILG